MVLVDLVYGLFCPGGDIPTYLTYVSISDITNPARLVFPQKARAVDSLCASRLAWDASCIMQPVMCP